MKKGWQTKTLGEVCDVMNGGTPKTGVPEYWDGNHRWITPAEMGKRLSPYVSDTERKITDLGLRDSSARMLPPNSVILSSRAPIGHLVINTEPMGTNQGCKGLIPRSQIEHKFLYFYLSSIVDLLNSLGTGATFKELSGGKLKEVTVPVPPLAEQQRIVGLLDEAFEGLATAKSNAEKNLQNARALFESHLQSVFTQRGSGWVEKKVCELLEKYGGEIKTGPFGTKLKASEYTETGVPVISVGEVRLGKIVLHDRTPRVDRGVTDRMPEYVLEEGDIVFGRKGGVERSACVRKDQAGWFLGSDGIRLRLPTNCNRRFLAYQFLSPTHKNWMLNQAVGTTMPSLNQKIIERIPIAICSLPQQQSIVEQLDALSEQTQHLARLYEQKLAALEALKKSLLHQAFTGEL